MSKILLLEDDLSLINGLTFAFQRAGFELDVARTIKEADTASTVPALKFAGKSGRHQKCQSYF